MMNRIDIYFESRLEMGICEARSILHYNAAMLNAMCKNKCHPLCSAYAEIIPRSSPAQTIHLPLNHGEDSEDCPLLPPFVAIK